MPACAKPLLPLRPWIRSTHVQSIHPIHQTEQTRQARSAANNVNKQQQQQQRQQPDRIADTTHKERGQASIRSEACSHHAKQHHHPCRRRCPCPRPPPRPSPKAAAEMTPPSSASRYIRYEGSLLDGFARPSSDYRVLTHCRNPIHPHGHTHIRASKAARPLGFGRSWPSSRWRCWASTKSPWCVLCVCVVSARGWWVNTHTRTFVHACESEALLLILPTINANPKTNQQHRTSRAPTWWPHRAAPAAAAAAGRPCRRG